MTLTKTKMLVEKQLQTKNNIGLFLAIWNLQVTLIGAASDVRIQENLLTIA